MNKWDSDIRIEIMDHSEVNEELIALVDTVIREVAPAIAPLKIQKVEREGNFKIYFREYPGQKYKRRWGVTLNKTGFASSNIISTQVWVFPCSYHNEKETFIKEFLHGLGLSNFKGDEALRDTLLNRKILLTFMRVFKYDDDDDDDDEYYNYNHLSEYDRRILKILYSPFVKPGLRKKEFVRLMQEKEEK